MDEMMIIRSDRSPGPSPRLHQEKKTHSICRDSHTILKMERKKIRIIHVFTPEIIKTDLANFRELVQKLTGKQAGNKVQDQNTKNAETVAICSDKGEKNDVATVFGGWDVKEESASSHNGLDDLDGFIQSFIQLPQVPPSVLEFEATDFPTY